MVLQRIPVRAYSTANARVSAFNAPLLVAYAARPALGRSAWRDDTFTIEPWPASTNDGIAARASHIGAVTLTRSACSQ